MIKKNLKSSRRTENIAELVFPIGITEQNELMELWGDMGWHLHRLICHYDEGDGCRHGEFGGN